MAVRLRGAFWQQGDKVKREVTCFPTQQALRWNLLFVSGQSMPSGLYCSVKGESWSPRSLTSTATAPCSAYICSVVPKYDR